MRNRARSLRRKPTDAEAALWALLRDRRLAQTKWRRQRPIGGYIVDFVCLEGYRVLRFWNCDVLKMRKSVLETILAACGLPF
jgi:very-short-patch-repair endonuclease